MRKNSKKYITLTCEKCQQSFQKELKEYTRQIKKGRKAFYCNLNCAGICHESKPDASFKLILRNVKKTAINKNLKFNLSLDYLQNLWKKQEGKCSYTNISLILPTYKYIYSAKKASLDRIDSEKGYVKGNVEFVCVFVNLGKNSSSKQEIIDFLKEYKDN